MIEPILSYKQVFTSHGSGTIKHPAYGSAGSTRFVNGGLRSGYFDAAEQSSNRVSSYKSFKGSSGKSRSSSLAPSLARSMGFVRLKKEPTKSRFNPNNLFVQPQLSSSDSRSSTSSVNINLSSESETVVYLDQIELHKYTRSRASRFSDSDSAMASERSSL